MGNYDKIETYSDLFGGRSPNNIVSSFGYDQSLHLDQDILFNIFSKNNQY